MQRLTYLALVALFAALFARPALKTRAICTAHGSHVYTADPLHEIVDCIGYAGPRITFVGPRNALPLLTRLLRTRTLAAGQTVLPGLTDAHAHLLEYGESVSAADLRGSISASDAARRVSQYIEDGKAPDVDAIITGLGWDQNDWTGAAYPTAEDLEIDGVKGRAVFLKRVDFHAAWVSKAVLERIGPLPGDIDGGEIVRDEQGRPTGVFLDAAMDYVVERLPQWTDTQRQHFLDIASRDLLAQGVVGVHDAAISRQTASFYRGHDAKLPLRIYGMLDCLNNSYCGDQVQAYHGERFTLRTAKIFGDGALGSWGAAMHEPYSDLPASRGILRSPAEYFKPLVKKWLDKGFQVAGHAIGDRANTVMVDAFEAALDSEADPASKRFRVEHTQIIRPDDVKRMSKLGIIASMQPTHATSDMRYAEARLGSERIKTAYAWQSIIKAGVHLPLSSDFPVEPISPWRGFFAAIARLDPDTLDSPQGTDGWYPSERLTRHQALAGFTSEAAFASFTEQEQGSLTVGKRADFIIVDRDVMRLEVALILKTKVLATVLDGRVAHGVL